MKKSKLPYRIDYHRRDDDSYMSSYTSESWDVVHVATGFSVYSTSGSWDQNADGESKSGTSHVELDDAGTSVLVKPYRGKTKRVELPVTFRLSADETALIHVFANGREKREELVLGDELTDRLEVRRVKRKLARLGARRPRRGGSASSKKRARGARPARTPRRRSTSR